MFNVWKMTLQTRMHVKPVTEHSTESLIKRATALAVSSKTFVFSQLEQVPLKVTFAEIVCNSVLQLRNIELRGRFVFITYVMHLYCMPPGKEVNCLFYDNRG